MRRCLGPEGCGGSYGLDMAISPYIAQLRRKIGTDLLLIPTVAVLPRDSAGRILLVRDLETGWWVSIGGCIEPDETPQQAARREAGEEAGVTIGLGRLLTTVGGPDYRLTYPNGDQVACVSLVYEATIESGNPRADGEETSEVGWFHPDSLAALEVNHFTRQLLVAALPLLDSD